MTTPSANDDAQTKISMQRQRIDRLEQENDDLKEVNDILRKAVAHYARLLKTHSVE